MYQVLQRLMLFSGGCRSRWVTICCWRWPVAPRPLNALGIPDKYCPHVAKTPQLFRVKDEPSDSASKKATLNVFKDIWMKSCCSPTYLLNMIPKNRIIKKSDGSVLSGKSIKDTRCCAESTLFFGSWSVASALLDKRIEYKMKCRLCKTGGMKTYL